MEKISIEKMNPALFATHHPQLTERSVVLTAALNAVDASALEKIATLALFNLSVVGPIMANLESKYPADALDENPIYSLLSALQHLSLLGITQYHNDKL